MQSKSANYYSGFAIIFNISAEANSFPARPNYSLNPVLFWFVIAQIFITSLFFPSQKTTFKFVLLLSWLSFVAGKPSSRCSQTSEIEHYDPNDPGAEIECKKCPECPEGLGSSPQCGSRVTKDIEIECKQCLPNITYSDSHGIGSCKPCQECGLKNVIQHCTPDQKRICGTICPKGYFLDHNHICQECYFCCDNVRESNRRQGCKEIGMDRDWQCEKTEQNQRCKEAFDKVATKPTDAKSTVLQDYNHTMTEKILKTQVYETNLSHISTDGGSTPMGSTATRKRATFPANDDSSIALSKQQQKGQEDPGFLRVIIGVPSFIFITVSLALLISKREKLFRFLRTKQSKLAGEIKTDDGQELLKIIKHYLE